MSTSAFNKALGGVDTDGNRFVSPEEFKKCIKEEGKNLGIKLTDEQIQEAISAMDKDKDGKFSFKGVIDWMVASRYICETCGLGNPHVGSAPPEVKIEFDSL